MSGLLRSLLMPIIKVTKKKLSLRWEEINFFWYFVLGGKLAHVSALLVNKDLVSQW